MDQTECEIMKNLRSMITMHVIGRKEKERGREKGEEAENNGEVRGGERDSKDLVIG